MSRPFYSRSPFHGATSRIFSASVVFFSSSSGDDVGDIEWNVSLLDADAENDADNNADEDVADADERGKVKKSTHDSEMSRRRVKISVLGFFFVGFWVGLWTVVIILGCGATYFSEPI